ncbi:UPF0223 family protein [Limosilactobacillus viscerum]|uniref:UPF0223 family protein n=1 Tax=Limosilactobacillus viscerum TaxID=2993450 RepID=UPI0024BBB195|nr:UPF0223 family protein [Limosilactobacillus viscerum]
MKNQTYSYPLDPEWTTDEITTVINFFRAVEDAYEVGISRDKFLSCYRAFQGVAGSKMGEKRLGRQFADASGYEFYPLVKLAQNSASKTIKMVGD